MAGKTSDRPWAEGFATGSTAASGIIHKQPASSAYGRSDVVPAMNRRNSASRRMVRCYGSRCGTRGRDYPLNRLFSSSWGHRRSHRKVRLHRMSPLFALSRFVRRSPLSFRLSLSRAKTPRAQRVRGSRSCLLGVLCVLRE